MGHLTADQRPSELAVGAQDAGSGTKTAAHTDHLQLSETSTYHFLHLAACFTFPQLQCTFEDTLHCWLSWWNRGPHLGPNRILWYLDIPSRKTLLKRYLLLQFNMVSRVTVAVFATTG